MQQNTRLPGCSDLRVNAAFNSSADASGYDRTPRVSLRSASVVGFYADRPAKKRRPSPVKTRSILMRLTHSNRRPRQMQDACCNAIEHRSMHAIQGKKCCAHAAALPQHGRGASAHVQAAVQGEVRAGGEAGFFRCQPCADRGNLGRFAQALDRNRADDLVDDLETPGGRGLPDGTVVPRRSQ